MAATTARDNLRLFPEPRLDRLYDVHNTDAFEWLRGRAQDTIHAVVTDPPYGLLEYSIAACAALALKSVGLESDPEYFRMARVAIPRLAALKVDLPEQNGARR